MANSETPRRLDLSSAPPIFVLSSHLRPEELHETEDLIYQSGGKLTYDAKEARLFIGRIAQKKRAAFDLRTKGVWTEEEATLPEPDHSSARDDEASLEEEEGSSRKKIKLSDHSLRSKGRNSNTVAASPSSPQSFWPDLSNHLLVLKLAWLDACRKEGVLVSYKPYTVYRAKIIPRPDGEVTPKTSPSSHTKYISVSSLPPRPSASSIIERAKADAATLPTPRRRWGDHQSNTASSSSHLKPPKLLRKTTSEMEYEESHPLPPLPAWATGPNALYACCRSTPMTPANEAFIAQLLKIKEARLLRLDDIGVRAYSTSIASISAYPHVIEHAAEITRLPGCEQKIAALWREWHDSAEADSERYIQVVKDLDAEPDIQVLRLFWNIWGVGPETARKFYFEHGWRELDDVVEFGWHQLTRVQQIGVKYYDEFQQKIPRAEVEAIRDVILRHARAVLNVSAEQFGGSGDVECIIVGGYRRGKASSGDVDVVLSHRDERKTHDLVIEVVRSLEDEGWITHTLTLHTTTSDRGQATLPFRGVGHHGHGFDTLDKALCVWQDPHFAGPDPTTTTTITDSESPAAAKNPNIHRRVDIIISPWRTVGCAVLGWSGGTTFQRDIRRFVSKRHALKFDSSGVRSRVNGVVLDLEAPRPRNLRAQGRDDKDNSKEGDTDAVEWLMRRGGKPGDKGAGEQDWDDADTWQDRERRVMDGLGIGFRPPEERCTG